MKTSLILIILFVPLILSGQYKSGEDVFIDQAYEGDLYVAGGTVTVSAPVSGDLVAAGGELFVYDSIGQDLIIAGGKISVNGIVGDDVRCAGGTVDIEGSILDDVIVFAGEVTINRDARVFGDLIVFGGKVRVLGDVSGNVKASAGLLDITGKVGQNLEIESEEFTLRGSVNGSAIIASSELNIHSDARIAGDLDYWTDEGEIDIPEAAVAGVARYDESLRLEGFSFDWQKGGAFLLYLFIAFLLATFLIIMVLQLLFHKSFVRATESWKTDVRRSLGYGMMYLLGTPVIIIILMTIVIGIPLGLFLLAFYIFSIVFGIPIFSLLLINFMNESQDRNWNKWIVISLALLTTIVIRFATIIPFIGWLIGLLILGLTYGAFIQSGVQVKKV